MADKPPSSSATFDRHIGAIYPAPRFHSSLNTTILFNRLNCAQTMESKHNKMEMSSLMSPPEPQPYDTFDMRETTPPMFQSQDKRASLPITLPHILSPPVSPETKHLTHTSCITEQFNTSGDPILYPTSTSESRHSESRHSHPPLFPPPSTTFSATVEVVESHISARTQRKRSTPDTYIRDPSPPAPGRDEYLLALEFKATLLSAALADPVRWVNRERQYLIENARARARMASTKKVAHSPARRVYPQLAPSPRGVQKRVVTRPVQKTQREKKVRRERFSATPETAGAGRSRNTGTSTREDKDFASFPDTCPPLSSLPSRPNSLKVEWKGAPLDLSAEPHKHLLHPDEVLLASNLRLDCATYLTSKRRIFLARQECFRGTWGAAKGKKEFRKTDAQQACKIDVNKASKLWMAFERVGWFEESWCVETRKKQEGV